MKNEFYNFNYTDYDGVQVKDFAFQTKNEILASLPEANDPYYVTYIQLEQNQTFDMVSDILYDSTDYWDLLAALNDKDPIQSLFFSDEIIHNYGINMTNLYEEKVSEQQLPQSVRNILLNRYTQKGIELNDNNKFIKVVYPTKLRDFLKVLRDNNII